MHVVPRHCYWAVLVNAQRLLNNVQTVHYVHRKWLDNDDVVHAVRVVEKLSDIMSQLCGSEPDKVVIRHYERYDWLETTGQDVQQFYSRFPKTTVTVEPLP